MWEGECFGAPENATQLRSIDATGAEFYAFAPSAPMANSFVPVLKLVRVEVERRLVQLLERQQAETKKLGPEALAMVTAASELTLRGGKRFRPALLYAAYRAIDESASAEPAFAAGAALELLQTYFLIHDDWMDQDEMRRGGPSVHVVLANQLGSRRLGESSAILAGDYIAALALGVLADAGAPPDRLGRALSQFARIQRDTILGQQLDLAVDASEIDVETMHDLKTGSYTVRGPVLLGAILAGASPAQIEELTAFANPLGVAFQLRDDLLGTFGSPERTGKPVGGDLRAGKPTSVLAFALRRATPAERHRIESVMGRQNASDAELAEVKGLTALSDARSAVETRLEELTTRAERALRAAHIAEPARDWFAGAAAALTVRDY